MKSLIRFEDTFSMLDIYCLAHGIKHSYAEIDGGKENTVIICDDEITKIDDSTYVKNALSSGDILKYSNVINDQVILKEYNINRIIFVYDLDGNGNDIKVMTSELFKRITDDLFHNKINGIEYRFAPIVWSAETLVLYSLFNEYKSGNTYVEPTQIIDINNTPKLQGRIINDTLLKRGFKKKLPKIKYKRAHEYLTSADVVKGLDAVISQFPDSINKEVIQFISGRATSDILFDETNIIDKHKQIDEFYQNNMPSNEIEYELINEGMNIEIKLPYISI